MFSTLPPFLSWVHDIEKGVGGPVELFFLSSGFKILKNLA